MKEFVEFRIIMEYAHLLFRDDEGTNLGDSVKVVRIDKNDPRFNAIGGLQKKALENNNIFYSYYEYKRYYTEAEIQNKRQEIGCPLLLIFKKQGILDNNRL